MAIKSVAVLKTFFETGDRPTESQFGDLIDSFLHKNSGVAVSSYSYDTGTGEFSIAFSDGGTIMFSTAGSTSEEISFINGLQEALDSKVDKEVGKGLSTNDFTNALKTKLDGLTQVVLPTEVPISYVTGLQSALDAKADDSVVVKSVNNQTPDAAGNVNVQVTGESSQFITKDSEPTLVDLGGGATYSFNSSTSEFTYVKTGGLINFNFTFKEISTSGVPSGTLMIQNLLYEVEARSNAEIFLIQGSSLTNTQISTANFIISKDPSNNMSLADKQATVSSVTFTNGTLEVSGFYVELQPEDNNEGIGFDPVGEEALGVD